MPKQDLQFSQPLVNAPGTLGFYPDFKRVPGLERLGAFFTNPISRQERKPSARRNVLPYEGGALLHTGMPNPGLRQVLKQYAGRWADCPLPVIPHLWIESIFQVHEMIELVEGLPGVTAISLQFPAELSDYDIQSWVEQIICELPVILMVDPERLPALAELLVSSPLSALGMLPPRGCLPDARSRLLDGHLTGPALFPQTLLHLSRIKKTILAILAGGGVHTSVQAQACLKAGAAAVQVDTILWTGGLAGWGEISS